MPVVISICSFYPNYFFEYAANTAVLPNSINCDLCLYIETISYNLCFMYILNGSFCTELDAFATGVNIYMSYRRPGIFTKEMRP